MKNPKIALALLALTAPAPLHARASALLKPTSGVTQALEAKSLSIDTHLQGAFARTTVTTIYANPNTSRIEADFLYSAPRGSIVTGFAYWYGQEKVVARVVEKGRAAKIYQFITSRMRDPALVEMIGKNAFRARIFPIEARADLKIEIQLAQTLSATRGGALWTYPLREETRSGPLQFSLRLRSSGLASSNFGNLKNGQFSLSKTDFQAKTDVRALVSQKSAPLRASLSAARDGGSDGFFALSLTPQKALARPKFAVSGVQTFDVVMPPWKRLAAGQNVLIYGRYRGGGRARVRLGNQSAALIFPTAREKRNLASLLWAAHRIESLSGAEKNRAKVMALSKRFGVPSKWTSWLAIPLEERANFKKQMLAADRDEAARLYAQATARGDRQEAAIQKRSVVRLKTQLQKMGHEYETGDETLLKERLGEELQSVRRALIDAKYGGLAKQRAQLQSWARNLERAGARDGAETGAEKGDQGVEIPLYLLEHEMRFASRLLTLEVEQGRAKGAKARGLETRLRHLVKTGAARNYGWGADSLATDEAQTRANALALEIATLRLSNRPNPRRQIAAQQALARLDKRFRIGGARQVRNALSEVGAVQSRNLAREVVRAERRGQPNLGRAQLERLARLMEVQPDDLLRSARTELDREAHNTATDELVSEILAGRENSPKARDLTRKIGEIGQKSEDWWQKEALNRAYSGRAHQIAFQIAQEKSKSAPDARKIAVLTTRLQNVVAVLPKNTRDAGEHNFLNWQATRVAAGEKAFDMESFRYRVAGLHPDNAGGGSYGAGDPLIAIEAPPDARSVVAIMPDGQIKNLEWRAGQNGVKGRWEVNFDIPTYAALGDYLITVIVIEKDGKRRSVRLRYRVDGIAPSGKANLLAQGDGVLKLDILAGDDVERAVAILPWGERQTLRRDRAGSFASTSPIPSEWTNRQFQVRFILIDRAHNRTELLVDWN